MPRVPWHISFLSVLFVTLSSWAQQILPFGSDFAPSFSFTEAYTESGEYSTDEEDFIDTTSYTLTFSAKASMVGIDPATFASDAQTLAVVVGNLDLSLPFAEGTRSVLAGTNVIHWDLEGFDPNTYDDLPRAGTVDLRYDGAKLTVTLALSSDWDDYSITAPDQSGVVGTLNFPLSLDFTVGGYGFTGRTVYVTGTAELYDLTVGHGPDQVVFTDLAKVRLSGEIDSTKPNVQITDPPPRQTVTVPTITVSGTASDDHALTSVLLKVNTDEFQPAAFKGNGTWSVPGVTLKPGDNLLVARSIDADGNTDDSSIRIVRYSVLSNLSVTGLGDGSGRITSDFFDPLEYIPAQPSPVRTTVHEAGQQLTVVATPGVDAVFDGWTSDQPLTPAQASSARLTFTMQPDMKLTAHFLRNPFVLARGRYTGLIQSADPTHRGVLTGRLSAKGSFSLAAKIGRTTVRVKGRFSSSGEFDAVVVSGNTAYAVKLHLGLSAGQRQITGTIRGGSIDAAVSADLSTYSKALNPVPAALIGDYNTLLSPAQGNSDPNFPVGIGFARLNVTASGTATINGQLGDGTPVSATGILAGEAGHNARYFAFFSSLYGRRGSILGRLTLDVSNPASDVSGQLEWYKPFGAAPQDLYPEGFSGSVQLDGCRFIKGATQSSGFLQSSAGLGQFLLKAPATGPLPPLEETATCLVEADGTVIVSANGSAIGASVLSIDPRTGLLTGTLFEEGSAHPVMGLIVGRKLNRGGGFFVRGARTGSIEIIP